MASTSTAKKAAPAKKSAPKRTAARKDAVAFLDADHKTVKKLFNEYNTLAESRSRSPSKRRTLADTICLELTVHAQVEEEIFYPAARSTIKDDPLLDEATVEHATCKDLIAQIQSMDVGDAMFDAKVKVLGEYIDHHVKEERTEMFPKVRKTKLDLVALREDLEARSTELKAELRAELDEKSPVKASASRTTRSRAGSQLAAQHA